MINYWMLMRQSLLLLGALPILAGALIGWLGLGYLSNSAEFVENLQQADARVIRFLAVEAKMLMDVEYEDSAGVKHSARF